MYHRLAIIGYAFRLAITGYASAHTNPPAIGAETLECWQTQQGQEH